MIDRPGNKALLVGFGFLFGALAWQIGGYVLEPRPYWGVEVRMVEREGDAVTVVADFTKGENCRLVTFLPFGIALESATPLRYTDLDGHVGNVDRLAGNSTLRVTVYLDRFSYESIQFRTRHDCDGDKVDRVFAEIPL